MDGSHSLSESDRLPAPDHPDDPVRRTRRRRGWTLVELVVVIAMLSVVAIIEAANYAAYLERRRAKTIATPTCVSIWMQADPTPAGSPRLICSEDGPSATANGDGASTEAGKASNGTGESTTAEEDT